MEFPECTDSERTRNMLVWYWLMFMAVALLAMAATIMHFSWARLVYGLLVAYLMLGGIA
ncbi:MAG: hypothetical protein WBB39_00310 [Candidatus Saccharimonadales bacterium]